jgi:hypothetical protein
MTYDDALAELDALGAARASDPAIMAGFCDSALQIAVGAVSPRLVWEGAQSRGMTALELAALCGTDPGAVADLMW